jgi:hypothetical protein
MQSICKNGGCNFKEKYYLFYLKYEKVNMDFIMEMKLIKEKKLIIVAEICSHWKIS